MDHDRLLKAIYTLTLGSVKVWQTKRLLGWDLGFRPSDPIFFKSASSPKSE